MPVMHHKDALCGYNCSQMPCPNCAHCVYSAWKPFMFGPCMFSFGMYTLLPSLHIVTSPLNLSHQAVVASTSHCQKARNTQFSCHCVRPLDAGNVSATCTHFHCLLSPKSERAGILTGMPYDLPSGLLRNEAITVTAPFRWT